MEITSEYRKQQTNRITWWGVAVNLFLAVIKTAGGLIGQSQALLADGIHSISDLASDGMVLLAAKHAGEEADEDHPYGHGRFETVVTVILGIFLIIVAGGIAYDAVIRLQHPEDIKVPATFTLAIAVISILANEGLFHATKAVAHKIRSPMLEANAWHHRSDAVSSIVVLIGISAAFFGYPLVDAVAAILVALMISKIGLDLSKQGMEELVDTALDAETVEKVREAILSIDDVRHMHMLRSRRMGHNALIDVHIQVSPRLSVSEGHHIAETVEKTIIDKFEEINDVTVHIDPENDEQAARCKDLPLRTEVLSELNKAWANHEVLKNIDDVTLHYLDGRVSVDASLPMSHLPDFDKAAALQEEFTKANEQIPYIGDCQLKFC